MKTILINPAKKEISELTINKSLKEYYKALNCRRVDFVNIDDCGGVITDLIVDDEFGLVDDQSWFLVDNQIIIGGNALIVDINYEGDTISTTWTLEQAKQRVRFV